MIQILFFLLLFQEPLDREQLDKVMLSNFGPGGLEYAIRLLSSGALDSNFREKKLEMTKAQLNELEQHSMRVVKERAITRKALERLFPAGHPIFDELRQTSTRVLRESIDEKVSDKQKLALSRAFFQMNFCDDIKSSEIVGVLGLTKEQSKVIEDLSYERELSKIDSDLKKEINKQQSMAMKVIVALDDEQREKVLYMLGEPIEKGNWVQKAIDYHQKKKEDAASESKDR